MRQEEHAEDGVGTERGNHSSWRDKAWSQRWTTQLMECGWRGCRDCESERERWSKQAKSSTTSQPSVPFINRKSWEEGLSKVTPKYQVQTEILWMRLHSITARGKRHMKRCKSSGNKTVLISATPLKVTDKRRKGLTSLRSFCWYESIFTI